MGDETELLKLTDSKNVENETEVNTNHERNIDCGGCWMLTILILPVLIALFLIINLVGLPGGLLLSRDMPLKNFCETAPIQNNDSISSENLEMSSEDFPSPKHGWMYITCTLEGDVVIVIVCIVVLIAAIIALIAILIGFFGFFFYVPKFITFLGKCCCDVNFMFTDSDYIINRVARDIENSKVSETSDTSDTSDKSALNTKYVHSV